MMELLAPAGSMEAVTAAVQNGADAVYFGYGDFNARRGARNLTREEAAAAVSYCHLRGCRVNLTLNTLLTDRELPAAAEAAATAGALAAAREQTSRLEADNAAAALINSELASRRDMLSTELAAALAAADRLRAELEDRKDTEQQIREFDAVLRRAEDMKRRYETRISRLQGVIRDMKKASGESDPEADEIAVIDMGAGSAGETKSVPLRKRRQDDGVLSESDWLENLPE